ncbi:MAG: carboxypeptidase-like regulatory domain-containing protein [Gemmatimonadota bacterium]
MRDSGGQPLVKIEVAVMPRGPFAWTDEIGRYTLANVPVGEHRLIARRIGYLPELSDVALTAGNAVEVDFVLQRVPQLLATQIVSARRERLPRVYERIDKHLGVALFSEDLEKYSAMNLDDVLDKYSPVLRSVLQAPRGCGKEAFYVDGHHQPPAFWLKSDPPPTIGDFVRVADIAVIEAFKSPDFINEPFIGDDGALSSGSAPARANLGSTSAVRGGSPLANAKVSVGGCQRVVLIWTKYYLSQRPRAIEQ